MDEVELVNIYSSVQQYLSTLPDIINLSGSYAKHKAKDVLSFQDTNINSTVLSLASHKFKIPDEIKSNNVVFVDIDEKISV